MIAPRAGRLLAGLTVIALVVACGPTQEADTGPAEVVEAPTPTVLATSAPAAQEDDAAPSPDPTRDGPDVDAADEPTPEATPEPVGESDVEDERDAEEAEDAGEAPTAALTGARIDEELPDRPALAIKVDNDRNARPQVGLEQADVVIVELVEGITRFVALFHSQVPETVGPVRSARVVDTELLPPFSPVLTMSGAAGPTYENLDASGIYRVVDDERLVRGFPEGLFRRDAGFPAPHNLFVDPAMLVELGIDEGDLPPPSQPWAHDETVPEGGQEQAGADLAYGGVADDAGWDWDGERWLRTQAGEPHGAGGDAQLAADNVVIVRVQEQANPTHPFAVIGEGDLTVLRDGQAFAGSWAKGSAEEQYTWRGPDGEPLPLAPGVTWVELVPSGGGVALR